MGTITKNFSYSEFEASDTAKKKGIVNVITTSEVRDAIKELCENVLQPLRDAYGKPLKINSGYRCPALNKEVGGQPDSQHTKGEAADIAAENPLELARLARDMHLPYDQMIVYPTFVHFSHRRGQRGQILYSSNYTGKKL